MFREGCSSLLEEEALVRANKKQKTLALAPGDRDPSPREASEFTGRTPPVNEVPSVRAGAVKSPDAAATLAAPTHDSDAWLDGLMQDLDHAEELTAEPWLVDPSLESLESVQEPSRLSQDWLPSRSIDDPNGDIFGGISEEDSRHDVHSSLAWDDSSDRIPGDGEYSAFYKYIRDSPPSAESHVSHRNAYRQWTTVPWGESGGTFTGPTLNGEPHGFGIYREPSGKSFEGIFDQGRVQPGWGTYRRADGLILHGNFESSGPTG